MDERSQETPTRSLPAPAVWGLVVLASVVGILWAGTVLNLLGTPFGVIGVVAFIALAAFAWIRTPDRNGHSD